MVRVRENVGALQRLREEAHDVVDEQQGACGVGGTGVVWSCEVSVMMMWKVRKRMIKDWRVFGGGGRADMKMYRDWFLAEMRTCLHAINGDVFSLWLVSFRYDGRDRTA